MAKDLETEFGIQCEIRQLKGKVFFEGSLKLIPILNFTARSINRVVVLLAYEDNIESLEDIKEVVNNTDWSNYIDKKQTIAVKSERVGQHKFTSLDMSKIIGQTIIENLKRSFGVPIRVNLESPDVKIIAELINKTFVLGIDTSGLSLHIRRYRVYNHPMPIRTTLAYTLVRLSDWKESEILVDPTCGGGTIPIEAALFARKIPPVKFRENDYLLYKLKFLNKEVIDEIKKEILSVIKYDKTYEIFGMDINIKHIKGAMKNAKNAGVNDTISFIQGNAERLTNYFAPNSVDKIVSNPPYSLPNKSRLRKFYNKFIKSVHDVLRPGGKSVIITSEIGLMKRTLKEYNFDYTVRRIFRYGKLSTGIFIVNK